MKNKTLKLIIGMIAAIMIFSSIAFAADEPKDMSTQAVNIIKLLEIANGDNNGNMNFDKKVTRAEFVKMAINASLYKDVAANIKLNISLFPDVKNSYWASGYISVAINNGLVNGYIDGTFKPNNNVTLEEAATIILRLLGYTPQDLIGNYPAAQLSKYESLKLNENIYAQRGDKLTREECMILIYNALSAKTKNGAIYCTTMNYAVNAENKLDYTGLLKSKLDGPYIISEAENSSYLTGFIENPNTAFYLNDTPCTHSDLKNGDVIYTSDKITTVFAYRKTATGVISRKSGDTVTLGNSNYTLSTSKAKDKISLGGVFGEETPFVTLILGIDDLIVDITNGSVEALNDNKDNSTLTSMIDETLSSPIYINSNDMLSSWNSKIPLDINSSNIYINGKLTKNYIPVLKDVIYYAKPFNGIWVYRNTQSGIIKNISGDVLSLGNDNFNLATNDAKFKVSTYGEFGKDDYVTLVLGKNSEVIDIIHASTVGIGTTNNDSSYSEIVSSSLKGPYVVTSSGEMTNLDININTASVYYSNYEIDKSLIKPYDVYYYSDVLNTVWIYRKTVTGTIESVSPASSPTSVTLSGNIYTIDNSIASYDLSTFGIYSVGDMVTLLLGMDNKVAGVIDSNTVSSEIYGVVTATGEKSFTDKNGKNYTANFVSVADTSGNTHSYEYAKANFNNGDTVRIRFDSKIIISKISTDISRTQATKLSNAFKKGLFTEDCNIIEYSSGSAYKVFPGRLSGCELDTEQFMTASTVQYFNFDENGYITDLILKNFTGDNFDYGIITNARGNKVTYKTNSVEKTFNGDEHLSYKEGAVKIITENNSVAAITNLLGYIDDIEQVTNYSIITSDNKEYALSDKVAVFIKNSDASYSYADVADIMGEQYKLKAYYDKLPKYGGRIRVIIAIN